MAKAQRKEITFGGLSNNMDESVESEGNSWLSLNTWHDKGLLEGIRRYVQLGRRATPAATDVALGLGYGKISANTKQKLVMSGNPTGGTFTLTFTPPAPDETTATITYAATAAIIQARLEALTSINVGDVIVTGGPFPGLPIYVEFIGQYARTSVAVMTDNSGSLTGGSSPDVAVTVEITGGENEVVYTVVQHAGTGDGNLYAIPITNGVVSETWGSPLATDFDPTDWHFQQFADKMFMCNEVDGLKWVYIGTSNVNGSGPAPPGSQPTATELIRAPADQYMVTSATTWAQSGLAVPATLTAGDGSLFVTFNVTEAGAPTLVLTGTLAVDKDWSLGRDVGRVLGLINVAGGVMMESITIEIVNADGTPVTIVPDYLSRVIRATEGATYWKWFHFADETRGSRDNIHKVIIRVPCNVNNGDTCLFNFYLGNTWPNDTRALKINPPNGQLDPEAVVSTIQYAYSYFDISTGLESLLSPVGTSQAVPSTAGDGCHVTLTGVGSTELNTTDDRVFFYRKSKSTLKWHRLPNTATVTGHSSYGATNVTASSPTMVDSWMEHELSGFPEPANLGFPPNNTGTRADCIGAWKQCLTIGSLREAYLSWVGKPLKYEPSPDTPDYISPDPNDFPDVGVTEYVSDNRSENVLALVGQDSLYAVTGLSAYAKVGDSPATASVFRRLPGSRGALGKRSVYRYGGGILIASQDGLWYYSVGRGFSGEDNGALVEREETGGSATTGAPGVRRSYQRFISELQSVTLTGTGLSGTFDLTWKGYTATIAVDATPLQVQRALEDSEYVGEGELEVFGEDLVDADGNAGGTMYIRYLGQYAGLPQSTYDGALLKFVPDMTGSVANVVGADEAISLSVVTRGTQTNTIVFEFNDEYWLFNQKSWLHQSRSRKWSEGIWSDSIKAVVANRERGVLMLSSDGKLLKLSEGVTTDVGHVVKWQYESPWMTGPRARVLSMYSVTMGAPTIRLYSDDGAGSVDVYASNSPHTITKTLDQGKFTTLGSSNRPGIRHKIIVSGVVGRDKVKSLALGIQPDGTDSTGS